MIKAGELRIGNWLSGNYTIPKFLPIEVYSLGDYGINELTEDSFEPIPLTPEILEKCGFENLDIHDWILKTIFIEDNGLGEGGEEWSVHVWNEFYQEHMMLPNYIYYLHQLQNLYFALTGEELNINLNVAAYQ
jgi:hypothetical protein